MIVQLPRGLRKRGGSVGATHSRLFRRDTNRDLTDGRECDDRPVKSLDFLVADLERLDHKANEFEVARGRDATMRRVRSRIRCGFSETPLDGSIDLAPQEHRVQRIVQELRCQTNL